MSGICAWYSFQEAPCDCDMLGRMGQSLAARGDATGMWSEGPIGLAMTVWQGSRAPASEMLPWIWHPGPLVLAADARLDQRSRLIHTLHTCALPLKDPSDAELIAAAYSVWGERCVEHLHGDFAFVLWDRRRRRLFGARSPMGLRPFVYHRNEQRFLCASEPRQLLADPMVTRAVNEDWIALWLTEGLDYWNGTAFRDIHELVPGHTLSVDAQGITITPYWTPSPRQPLRHASQQDAIAQFRHLLCAAVQDRMESDRPVLFDLSGGLDSSSLVCVGHQVAEHTPTPPLSALHVSSSRYGEVHDLPYAHLVAQTCGIDLHALSYEALPAFEGIVEPRRWTSTPTIPPLFLRRLYQEQWALARRLGARTHIRGDFGDQLLSASLSYLTTSWEEHRQDEFWREVRCWERIHGMNRDDLVATWVLKPQQDRRRPQSNLMDRAPWVKPWVWQRRADLLQQDAAYFRQACPDPFTRPLFRWMRYHKDAISMQEDGIVAAGVETSEPYTDLRLIEFMLATPPQVQIHPGQRKFLLWAAMEGLLPEPVRQRKEKGRIARILFQGIAHSRDALRDMVLQTPELLSPYIDAEALAAALDRVAWGDTVHQAAFLSTVALVFWAHRLPWAGGRLLCEP